MNLQACGKKGYQTIIDAEPVDVALVLRAGKTLYGEDDIVDVLRGIEVCDGLNVCG